MVTRYVLRSPKARSRLVVDHGQIPKSCRDGHGGATHDWPHTKRGVDGRLAEAGGPRRTVTVFIRSKVWRLSNHKEKPAEKTPATICIPPNGFVNIRIPPCRGSADKAYAGSIGDSNWGCDKYVVHTKTSMQERREPLVPTKLEIPRQFLNVLDLHTLLSWLSRCSILLPAVRHYCCTDRYFLRFYLCFTGNASYRICVEALN